MCIFGTVGVGTGARKSSQFSILIKNEHKNWKMFIKTSCGGSLG